MTNSGRAEFFIQGRAMLAKPYHYQASGLDNIFLLNGVTESETSYGPMVHIENINGLHHAIGLHIVEQAEPMRGAEFRFLRKQMGLSQVQLAELLGVTDQTIANYEKENTSLGAAEAFIRDRYLISILPEKTRVGIVQAMTAAPIKNVRQKLPDVPRLEIVEQWREEPRLAA